MKKLSKLSLRKANFSDIEFLWYLRNQPDVYKYSRVNRPVLWKEHIDWVLPILLGMTKKELFVIQNLERPIGQIRFDYKNSEEVEISISILKEFRGKGFAIKSLNLAIKKLKEEKKVKRLIAEVNKKNLPSKKLFERLNFKFIEKTRNWLKYSRDL